MKNAKRIAALLSALALILALAATAAAEAGSIRVSKKDLSKNKELPTNVSNILVLLQDGETTNTLMIASINDRTGRAVMTRVDAGLEVDVRDAGAFPVGQVYALGAKNSKGLLAMRTLNELLSLNIGTYVAVDMSMLPELTEAVDALNMDLTAEEAEALGLPEGRNALTGEQVLAYVRLALDGDDPARSRGYDALMQLLYQGLHSDDLMGLLSLGQKLLSSMDTNLNPLSAMTLVTAVQGGDDRRELALPGNCEDAEAMRAAFHKEVYE